MVLARLRSGHNRLNAHMHRKLNIVPSPTCPCGEEDQTTEHVLQICNRHQPERIAQWPSANPLHQKLYGGLEDLKKTTNFITAAGLVVKSVIVVARVVTCIVKPVIVVARVVIGIVKSVNDVARVVTGIVKSVNVVARVVTCTVNLVIVVSMVATGIV